MNTKHFLLLLTIFILKFSSTKACDGMSNTATVSNQYLGNNQYLLTIQYCEAVSNGSGSATYGLIVQIGGATAVGTTTPSYTSPNSGVTINYNAINANTVQWGEWDNNPAVTPIMVNGDPEECFTFTIKTNGLATSLVLSGSSAGSNLGAGFTNWMGRWCCKTTLPVPPVTCASNWTAPTICPTSTGLVNLNTSSSLTGVFSGPGVNSATGMFNPVGQTYPVNVTFTVGDAGLSCSTTHAITSPYTITPVPDHTICQGQSVTLSSSASAVFPCNYTLRMEDSYGDGWQGGKVKIYINGVLYGTFACTASLDLVSLPVSTGDVITMNYTAGSFNSEVTLKILNSAGTVLYTKNNPPNGWLGGGITANCGTNTNFTYAWTPTSGLGTPNAATTTASPTSTTTYTLSATSVTTGCVLTELSTVTVNPSTTPTFNPVGPYCQNAAAPALATTSTNGITGTWSPAITTATVGTQTYTFTPTAGQCASNTTLSVQTTPLITPTFNPLATVCIGAPAPSIPTTSINGITGSWSPAVSTASAGTFTYTFTPNPGQCASTTTLSLTVTPGGTPTFNPLNAVCLNAPAPTLPATSTNGITGTWSGTLSTNIPGTNTYTFTPNPGQCSSPTTINFTVNPLPTIVASSDAAICIGASSNISASGGSTYTWNNGLSAGTSHTVSPASTTTYVVTGTDANGCVNTDQVTITVNPLPTIVASPDAAICIGASSNISASGGSTYTWNNGLSAATSHTVSPASTTTYVVTGTDANGCVNTDQVTITVNPLPTIVASPDAAICLGANSNISVSGGSTYTWNNGLSAGTSHTVSPASTTTYSVTGTDANGCINTDQVTITVNPLPTIVASPDAVICIGDQTTISATGAVTYTWNNGLNAGASHNVSPASTTSYNVIGTDINGCVSNDIVSITVMNLLPVNAGNDITICEGESVTLTGSGASNYTWDNNVVNGQTFYPSVGTHTYILTGSSNSGCVNYDTVQVLVNPKPIVQFTSDKTKGCIGDVITFTNTTSNSVNCEWTISNGMSSNNCSPLIVTFTNAGWYDATFTITDVNGCTNTKSILNMIEIIPNAIADFNASSYNLQTIDTHVDFENLSSNANSYLWNFGDGSSNSSVVNPSHQFPDVESQKYIVTLVAYNALGCPDTIRKVIEVTEELIFYVPNTFTPDDDEFNQGFKPIFTSGYDPSDYGLYIFNRWGELIFESHNAEIGWDGTYASKGAICQDGTYTWKIEFKTKKNDERKMKVGHVNIIR